MTAAAYPPRPAWKAITVVTGFELKRFWSSASAGVTLLVFLGLSGFFFYNSVATYILSDLQAATRGLTLDASLALFSQSLNHIPLVLMLVTPLVTMRALASPGQGGGLAYLSTLPLSPGRIILGQYFAASSSLALLSLLAMVPYVFLVWAGVGHGVILLTSLLGLWSLASAFAAVGLAFSAAFPSPVGAGLGTLGFLGLMWVLGWAAPVTEISWAQLWPSLAFGPRLSRLVMGLVNLNDLAFFVSLTAVALITAKMFLELRRHSGAQ